MSPLIVNRRASICFRGFIEYENRQDTENFERLTNFSIFPLLFLIIMITQQRLMKGPLKMVQTIQPS